MNTPTATHEFRTGVQFSLYAVSKPSLLWGLGITAYNDCFYFLRYTNKVTYLLAYFTTLHAVDELKSAIFQPTERHN